mgnify:CR=1 FL=1
MDAPGRFLRGISSDFDDVGMYIGPVVAALFLVRPRRQGPLSLWRLGVTLPVFLCNFPSACGRARACLGRFTDFGLRLDALRRTISSDLASRALSVRRLWTQSVRGLLDRRYPPPALWGRGDLGDPRVRRVPDLFVVSRPIYRSAFRIPPIETISFKLVSPGLAPSELQRAWIHCRMRTGKRTARGAPSIRGS